jgi:hypothetical protein
MKNLKAAKWCNKPLALLKIMQCWAYGEGIRMDWLQVMSFAFGCYSPKTSYRYYWLCAKLCQKAIAAMGK